MPHLREHAEKAVQAADSDINIGFQGGSFFDATLPAADIYILKRILHDWNDEDCIKILKTCSQSLTADTSLYIFDAVVAESNQPDFAKNVDMVMLVLFGGKERTAAEWKTLITKAGLSIKKIEKTGTMLSCIHVCKA